ncbi:heterokaryon incompatibility protein-domain-containing protein, partial [Leptodontidium sp. 2 PMI_412]
MGGLRLSILQLGGSNPDAPYHSERHPNACNHQSGSRLQAMQKLSMFRAGFKVWIDAISINQRDIVERGLQVAKMRELYTVAWSVVIWLGEESEDSGKAIKLLDTLSRYFDHGKQHRDYIPNLDLEIEVLRSSLRSDPEFLGRGAWVALREFLARPYWNRLWIIQEVVISASKTVLCGNQAIDWDTLCCGLGTIHNVLFVMKNELLEHDQKVCGKVYSTPWNTKNFHRVMKDLWLLDNNPQNTFRGNPWDIQRLLVISKQSLASDARDKFYGLLALMEPAFARKIKISYGIDAGAVFNMVAMAHILTYKSLEILREANPWGGNNSATWAPDWTWNGMNRSMMHPMPYNTSGTAIAKPRFSGQDKILTCRGVIIDKIDGLGPRHRLASEDMENAAAVWTFIPGTMVQAQAPPSNEINFSQLRSDLCHALTRDRAWEAPANESTWHLTVLNLPADEDAALKAFAARGQGWEWLASQRSYYQRWSLWRRAHAEFMIYGQRLDDFFTGSVLLDGVHDDYRAAYNAARLSSQAERLVVTENGRIGWVPDNNAGGAEEQVQKGDLFCAIFGCSTPIVMRPHRDGFLVLGEGYLQGVMEGEALEMTEDGE